MVYIVYYELEVFEPAHKVIKKEMPVEAQSEKRALEHCTNVLDQQYGESTLLECKVVGTR